MDSFALIATYVSYVFVVTAYAIKVQKYFKMPLPVRWELYPVLHEKGYRYGGSYLEEVDWWTKPRQRNRIRPITDLVKKYLTMGSYFERFKSYWFALYPWHMGFLLIVFFDGLILLDAALIKTIDLEIAGNSANGGGQFLYYLTLVAGLTSFGMGCLGSVGMLLMRSVNENLREYATPQNYFNYLFFLGMFATGWVAWAVDDPTFTGFREFWVGVLSASTAEMANVGTWEYIHIIFFSAFLVYLPLTRSTHYITKILYFFWVKWGDTPNLGDPKMEARIVENLNYEPKWSAQHHKTGRTWAEIATRVPQRDTQASKEG